MGRDNAFVDNCVFEHGSFYNIGKCNDWMQDANLTNFDSYSVLPPANSSPNSDQFSSNREELAGAAVEEFFSFDSDSQDNETSLPEYADLDFLLTSGLPDYLGPKKATKRVAFFQGNTLDTTPPRTKWQKVRDRRRKDEHNKIERRRRYRINDLIKKLATLLPPVLRNGIKLNKGSILKATVDYLHSMNENRSKICRIIEQARKLKAENEAFSTRIKDMESLLNANDVSQRSAVVGGQQSLKGKRPNQDSLHSYAAKPECQNSKDYQPLCKLGKFSTDASCSESEPNEWASENFEKHPSNCQDTESFLASINIQSDLSPFNDESDNFSFEFLDMFLN